MKSYCHLCGVKYIDAKTQPWECPSCGNLSFENSSPSVDVIFFDSKKRVLLSKRGIEPAKGKYDFPGGFVILGETLEEALNREIHEELGLVPEDFTKPVYLKSYAADYEFSKETKKILGSIFYAQLITNKKIVAHDDVESISFASIDELVNYDFSQPMWVPMIKEVHALLFGGKQ